MLDGAGAITVSALTGAWAGGALEVDHPGAYPLVEHERHTAGELHLEIGAGVECLATCFTPGVLEWIGRGRSCAGD